MEKNLINEDIRKMMNLIDYDREKTLSENKISYKNVFINEAQGDGEQTNLEKLKADANKYNDRYKYNFFNNLRDKDFVNSLSQNVLDVYYLLDKSSCGIGTTIPELLESVEKIQSKSELKELNDALSKMPICGDYASLDDVLNGELGAYDKSTLDTIKKHFEDNNIAILNYGISSRGYWKQGTIEIVREEEPKTSNTWDNYPCVTDGEKGTLKDGSIAYGKRLTTQSEYPYGWFYDTGRVKLYTSENKSKMYEYKCQDGKIEIEGYEIKNSSSKSKYRRTAVTYNDVLEGKGTAELYDKGGVVEEIQKKLNILLKLGLDMDGAYGPKTKKAVERFQIKFDLTDDGIFKQETAKKLDAELKKLKQPQESKPAPQESKPAPQEPKPVPQTDNQQIEVVYADAIEAPETIESQIASLQQEIQEQPSRQQCKTLIGTAAAALKKDGTPRGDLKGNLAICYNLYDFISPNSNKVRKGYGLKRGGNITK